MYACIGLVYILIAGKFYSEIHHSLAIFLNKFSQEFEIFFDKIKFYQLK